MNAEIGAEFIEVYEKRHELAKEWKRQGRKIFGIFYGDVPEEILSAAGIIPVQLTKDEEHGFSLTGKTHFGEFYCDIVSNILGQVLRGVYDYLDGVVISDACETAKVFAGVWDVNLKPSFLYWLPTCSQRSEGARIFYVKELTQFKKTIGEFIGQEISVDGLSRAIEAYDENRKLMKQLYEIIHNSSAAISERTMVDIFKAGLVLPKEEHNKMLQKFLNRILPEPNKRRNAPRLFLSTVLFEDCISKITDIISMIEDFGGKIVSSDLLLGPRYSWDRCKATDDALNSLVDRYLGRAHMPFKATSDVWIEPLLAEAKKSNAEGAIFVIPKYCTVYLWEFPYVQSEFEKKGIRVLMLESEEGIPEARTRTRVEAFLESLKVEDRG